MHINGQYFQTIWADWHQSELMIIDQKKLPFQINIKKLKSFNDSFQAIANMEVRGAPLIGVTAAYGLWLALNEFHNDSDFRDDFLLACKTMKKARPTAVNLAFGVDKVCDAVNGVEDIARARELAFQCAELLKSEEIACSEAIGEFGCELIEQIWIEKGRKTVNILTHCNAGWLACIDWGTALAPVYKAHLKGIPVHVWVDETRPRNQGSKLTAFELHHEGINHTVIVDNAGGHLMQHGMVDMVIVGSDRTTRSGDVCNKIGTYLKALAAFDNKIPFYVALPTSSIDLTIKNGAEEIPIETRHDAEVRYAEGENGKTLLVPEYSPVVNHGFDVTPARLVTSLITERGICPASEDGILSLFAVKH
jgi:methylthioribose-1-phosphate isomerase